MVLVYDMRLLKSYLFGSAPSVCSNELLEHKYGILGHALYPHFLPETVVDNDLHHSVLACRWRLDLQLMRLLGPIFDLLFPLPLPLFFLLLSLLLHLFLVVRF